MTIDSHLDLSLRELPFAPAEFAARLARLRSKLMGEGLAAGLYCSPEDIYYLSGYNTPGNYYGFQILVVPVDKEPFFVCRLVEESNVLARSVVDHRYVFRDTDDPVRVLLTALSNEGILGKRIEMDPHSVAMSPKHYLAIQGAVGSDFVEENARCLHVLRRRKSEAEVEWVRQAAVVCGRGMDAAVSAVHAGATEDDVAAACYAALILAGGEYPGMPPMIASGPRAGLGHATWEGHRVIEQGDVVLLEIPGCVKRYHACQARSIAVGEVKPEYLARMDVLVEAREAALSVMKPGNTSSAVDAALRQPLIAAGLADHHLHRAGYGLGIAYPPHWDEGGLLSLRAGDETILEPNMIFHLIPALYYFNETLLACTETVLITENEPEILVPNTLGFIVV